nr:uncharacterized protein LOC107453727 isoform X2 [Parasteatoda tepidariorum]
MSACQIESLGNRNIVEFKGLLTSNGLIKRAVLQYRNLDISLGCSLRITNVQTKEVYDDDNAVIPKNTAIRITRVPVASALKRNSQYCIDKKKMLEDNVDPEITDDVPEELLCIACNSLLQDAVLAPCCANSFCYECGYLAFSNSECPVCHDFEVTNSDNLIPCLYLRKAVQNFKSSNKVFSELSSKSKLPEFRTTVEFFKAIEKTLETEKKPLDVKDSIKKDPTTALKLDNSCQEFGNSIADESSCDGIQSGRKIETIITSRCTYGQRPIRDSYFDDYSYCDTSDDISYLEAEPLPPGVEPLPCQIPTYLSCRYEVHDSAVTFNMNERSINYDLETLNRKKYDRNHYGEELPRNKSRSSGHPSYEHVLSSSSKSLSDSTSEKSPDYPTILPGISKIHSHSDYHSSTSTEHRSSRRSAKRSRSSKSRPRKRSSSSRICWKSSNSDSRSSTDKESQSRKKSTKRTRCHLGRRSSSPKEHCRSSHRRVSYSRNLPCLSSDSGKFFHPPQVVGSDKGDIVQKEEMFRKKHIGEKEVHIEQNKSLYQKKPRFEAQCSSIFSKPIDTKMSLDNFEPDYEPEDIVMKASERRSVFQEHSDKRIKLEENGCYVSKRVSCIKSSPDEECSSSDKENAYKIKKSCHKKRKSVHLKKKSHKSKRE